VPLKGLTNTDSNTDFVSVIEGFEDNYPDYFPQNPELATEDRVVVITILSDFIHDVDKKAYYNRASKIEENWLVLEEKIRYHSHADVVANLIILTRSGQVEGPHLATHRQINRPCERYFPLSKFPSDAIAEDVQNHLPCSPMYSQQPIRFYYHGQYFVNDFTLRIDKGVMQKNKHFDLTIAIPEKANQPPVNLHWTLLTTDEDYETDKYGVEDDGQVGPIGKTFSKNELTLNDEVRLKPWGRPSQLKSQTMSVQLTSSTLKRVYHMDIRFIKVMPAWYAGIIIVLHAILLVLFVVLVIQSARILINKWRERMVVPGTGKGITKIKPEDLEGSVWESSVDWLTFKPGRHYVRSPLDRSKPVERGTYQLVPREGRRGRILLRFFGSLEGSVHNPPISTDWEITHWGKHKLDLAQSGQAAIHYKRRTGPIEGNNNAGEL